jgi:iron complex transport system substrate-binding protein
VNPAQSRYGDQPSGWKSGRRAHGVLDFLREKGKGTMDSYRQTPSAQPGMGFFYALATVALAAALLAGCAVTTPASPSASPAPSFPMSLVDDEGTTVALASRPARVISLSPAFTEIVFALGAGDRLVGGTDFDDYPPEAVGLPDVASYTGVVIEKVVELNPDLVIAGGNNYTSDADVTRLRELGFQVLVTYPPTVSAVLDDIRLIGKAIGADSQAATLTAGMQQRIDEVETAVEGLERQRVFYEIGYEPEIYGPAPGSFVADMISVANGEPITTTDPAVFSISLEQLIAADPQVIVLGDAAYGTCPSAILERPGWGDMAAVKSNSIRPADDLVVTRPGPRLAEGLVALALAIHPDADISPPADARPLCTTP